ncbi:MAG TPA: endonuclease domain-containing protein [Anaeromyxobacteraceae bacterium]|nr:endonuclease domain-containing protein [Anaeromyxobacteraceae bacterium]
MVNPRLPAIDFRRLQRISSTDAEARIWFVLRNRHLGAKFRRQATAGTYTLDFFCPCLQLAVEVDGSQHRDDVGLRYDAERDAALASAGIKVLRFTNQEALAATESVALAILDEVERLTANRPKPPVGSARRRDRLLPHPGPLPR